MSANFISEIVLSKAIIDIQSANAEQLIGLQIRWRGLIVLLQ